MRDSSEKLNEALKPKLKPQKSLTWIRLNQNLACALKHIPARLKQMNEKSPNQIYPVRRQALFAMMTNRSSNTLWLNEAHAQDDANG